LLWRAYFIAAIMPQRLRCGKPRTGCGRQAIVLFFRKAEWSTGADDQHVVPANTGTHTVSLMVTGIAGLLRRALLQ
jgi:hypothetical protein